MPSFIVVVMPRTRLTASTASQSSRHPELDRVFCNRQMRFDSTDGRRLSSGSSQCAASSFV
jgi:hypothetical protein